LLESDLLRRAGRTVEEALDAWYKEKLEHGIARPTTCDRQKPRLRLVFSEYLDANLTSITPEVANAIYRAQVERPTPRTKRPRAAASHRHYLKLCQGFFRWCVAKNWVSKNPFADVYPVGRVNRGKPQLRSEEVSRYIAAGLKRFVTDNDRLALAAAMLPVFSLRAGEALSRRVRDIDRGRVWRLHIDRGLEGQQESGDTLKTDNAVRVLEIPVLFIPHLERPIQGRDSTEYLFGPSIRTGKRKSNQSLWCAVTRLCDDAGVPRVCPHSMRGYYASAGVRSGALPHVVAANMGHSSFTVTAQHYAKPEAIAEAHNARVLEVLDLEQSDALSHLPTEQLIAKLPAATLAQIAELVSQRTPTAPTLAADGGDLYTEIRTESVPAISKPANSRRKN
jgi:integrase